MIGKKQGVTDMAPNTLLVTATTNESKGISFADFTYNEGIPSVCDLYKDLTIPFVACIAIAALFFVIILWLFNRQVNYIFKHTPRQYLARTLLLNSAYPIVATAAVTSILVPKSIVLCDTVCHLTFVFLAYQFFCLCIDYANGETNLIKLTNKEEALNIRTPPFFCCCPCLKPAQLTKKNLKNVRLMILQMPIIQGIILLTVNIANMENPAHYRTALMYLAPFLIISIITGVWGLNITVRSLMPYLMPFGLKGKFLAVQLVLVFSKLQVLVTHAIVGAVPFNEPQYPVTPKVLTNSILQVVILFEMVLLSLWAAALYKSPAKSTPTLEES